MTKGQIHFSNFLEELVEILKKDLFFKGARPFEKRLIVVPHLELKNYLMQAFAKDPDLQIAAGINIVNLTQAFGKITKKVLPSTLELSLFLQHTLRPLIDEEKELKEYFKGPARERRIAPFCDKLAHYFHRIFIYGKKQFTSWEEKLWEKVISRWTFPIHFSNFTRCEWKTYLFGFSFLPKIYFEFFNNIDAKMYLFSPCEIFWGDFYSEKERSYISKEFSDSQYDLFEQTFEEQNPLLANWGKVGRKFFQFIEEKSLETKEHYRDAEGKNALQQLQRNLLKGSCEKIFSDQSIHCFSGATPLREVEILKDILIGFFQKGDLSPKDVQVFAPDINAYAPFIQATFQDFPYSISGLEFSKFDPIGKAFLHLIELPKKRFSLESVLQFLDTPPLKEKFHLEISQIEKWLEHANIKWGFSKEQRLSFYLKDLEKTALSANPEEGTWERGLKRLLLGLGQIEGEDLPLCCIENSEMEKFDQLYTLITSLADDLSPFHDGTKWTIPTWFRYFACLVESYFPIDASEELCKQFQQIAGSTDFLDKECVPFEGVESGLIQILTKKTKSIQSSQLQAIRFASFEEGAIQPGKILCLLGMQEGIFPRQEESLSLYVEGEDFRPKKPEQDKALFLQAVMFARETLLMSFVKNERETGGVSPIVEELLAHVGGKILHHPPYPFDSKYFQGGVYESFSQEQYALAKAKQSPKKKPPLIPQFYEKGELIPPIVEKREVDLQKLFKFARHPLRYYLNEVCEIYPDVYQRKGETEYLLNPLLKIQLVRQALKIPLEQVLVNAEKRGDLPLNLFKPFAQSQIQEELENWNQALTQFGIDPNELETKKIDEQLGKFHLKGKLEFFTEKGIPLEGKNCLEDQIKFWPQILLGKRLGIPTFFVKDASEVNFEGDLEEYLEYFLLAENSPSPLIPKLAQPLLKGGEEDLKKKIRQIDDPILNWLNLRDPLPNSTVILHNWGDYLRKLFEKGIVDATV